MRFPLYSILYTFFFLVVAVFIYILVSSPTSGGLVILIESMYSIFIFVVSMGTWLIVYYLLNIIFFLRKEYPHSSDNIFFNTIFNVVLLAFFFYLFPVLMIFPALNIVLNLWIMKNMRIKFR
jgi:hypothetical protein